MYCLSNCIIVQKIQVVYSIFKVFDQFFIGDGVGQFCVYGIGFYVGYFDVMVGCQFLLQAIVNGLYCKFSV